MCLDVVLGDAIDKEGIGWKVYRSAVGWPNLFPWAYGLPFRQTIERNKWLKADTGVVINTENGDRQYKSGFHIFTEYPEFYNDFGHYTIVPVKYRNATVYGKQNVLGVVAIYDCVVAEEIMILEN